MSQAKSMNVFNFKDSEETGEGEAQKTNKLNKKAFWLFHR